MKRDAWRRKEEAAANAALLQRGSDGLLINAQQAGEAAETARPLSEKFAMEVRWDHSLPRIHATLGA